MSHFFKNFPRVDYDLERTGNPINIQNPFVRFRLQNVLENRSRLYYNHNVEDGQTASFIAHRYYEDETLDWVIYVTNNIIDPEYDWPLDYDPFIQYIRKKYGSVSVAQTTVHSYEQIITGRKVLFDGTIVQEKTLTIDETTYNSLPENERRMIDCFTYETKKNDEKKKIKILHRDYLPQFLAEAESIFE